eukprot:3379320-Pleurochrysis_carterae.AAC.1
MGAQSAVDAIYTSSQHDVERCILSVTVAGVSRRRHEHPAYSIAGEGDADGGSCAVHWCLERRKPSSRRRLS